MSIAWDKRNRRWRFYFDRTVGGVRARGSKLLPTAWSHAQAAAYDKAEEARLYGLATGIEQAAVPAIATAVQLYLDHNAPEHRTAKTTALRLALLMPYIQHRPLSDLPEVAREYRKAHSHLAPGTIRERLAYLKAAVTYAHQRHGLGDRDYSVTMDMPAPSDERHEYLEVHEFVRLRSKIKSPQVRALLTLAFYTGLRWRANLLTLTRQQIIRRGKQAWLSIPRTKNDRPLMVPVHTDAVDALKAIPFGLDEHVVYAEFDAARRAIGRPGLRIHDLRHSLASVLVSNGATLAEIGAVLGHKSVSSTKRYAHLYPARAAELVNRIGKRR